MQPLIHCSKNIRSGASVNLEEGGCMSSFSTADRPLDFVLIRALIEVIGSDMSIKGVRI